MNYRPCKHLAPLALLALPALGMAQSNVTISGNIYLGVRHVSNASASGGSVTQVGGSPDGMGSLRFSGTEDLGGGLRASFQLDSLVQADVGVAGASAGFWNRNSTVGLHGDWGNLTLGRQVGTAGTVGPLVYADPLNGNSNYLETTWAGSYTGMRFNNSIQYSGVFSGVYVGGLLALGEQAGSSGKGRTMALSAGYQSGPIFFRSAVQESRDGGEHKARIYSLGGYVAVSPNWMLHGAYFGGKYDKGFASTTSSSTGALFGTSMSLGVPLPAEMNAKGYLVGVTWRVAPRWTVKTSVLETRSEGATFISGLPGVGAGDGKQRMFYLFGDYALSKRTSLQAGVDINQWSGKWGGFWGSAAERGAGLAIDGHNSRTVYGAYIKHSF